MRELVQRNQPLSPAEIMPDECTDDEGSRGDDDDGDGDDDGGGDERIVASLLLEKSVITCSMQQHAINTPKPFAIPQSIPHTPLQCCYLALPCP